MFLNIICGAIELRSATNGFAVGSSFMAVSVIVRIRGIENTQSQTLFLTNFK